MNCEEAKARIQGRIDDPADNPALDAHVATCGKCRTDAEQMRLLTAALGELRRESEKIVASSPTDAPRDHRRRTTIPSPVGRFVRVARVAADLAIIVTGSVILNQLIRDGEQSTIPTADSILVPGGEDAATAVRRDPRVGISLRGKSADTVLAVAVTTKDANVQMYWLYPVLDKKSTVDPSL